MVGLCEGWDMKGNGQFYYFLRHDQKKLFVNSLLNFLVQLLIKLFVLKWRHALQKFTNPLYKKMFNKNKTKYMGELIVTRYFDS